MITFEMKNYNTMSTEKQQKYLHYEKPNELEKSLNNLGLASIKSPLTNVFLKTRDNVTNFDNKNSNILKNNFCSLAHNLLSNFPPPSLTFGIYIFSSEILQKDSKDM